MNLGKGFSVPQEKRTVQNGHFWIPATPEKPVVQIPNYPPAENNHNETRAENWQDLLGIYSGLLQDTTCNVPSQKFNLNDNAGLNCNREVEPIENRFMLTQNFNATGLSAPHCREQNILPLKVDSLADLMGMRSSVLAPSTIEEPTRRTHVMGSPLDICSRFQVESDRRIYEPASAILQQNRFMQINHENGAHNLQPTPNGRLSARHVSSYNLNLPPQIEAGESSSAARPFRLAPVTPDQQKQLSNQDIIQVPQLFIDKIPNQEKDTWVDGILSQESEIVEKLHNEVVQNTLDTPSTAPSTAPKEMNILEGGNEGGIDLNKTPPQKPPKRRKHRPKVVVEGKPKRTAKPADTKNNTPKKTPKSAEKNIHTPEGTSTGKRKYVRRKGINTSTTLSTDVANEVEEDRNGSASKSCRRSLNFDLENGVEKETQGRELEDKANNNEVRKLPFNLNLSFHDAEWAAEFNEPSTSGVNEGISNICTEVKQLTSSSYDYVHSAEKTTFHVSQPPAPKNHTLNFIARRLSAQNVNLKQTGVPISYDQMHHHLGGGILQNTVQANTNEINIDGRRQLILHGRPQPLGELVNMAGIRGSNREHSQSEARQPQSVNLMGSQLWVNKVSGMDNHTSHIGNVVKNGSESIKESRVEDIFHKTSSSMTSGLATVEDCQGQIISSRNMSFHAQSSTLHLNDALRDLGGKGKWISDNPNNEAYRASHDWYMSSTNFGHMFQQQKTSCQVHECAGKMEEKSHDVDKAQSTVSLSTVTDCNQESSTQRDKISTQGNEISDSLVHVPVKRQAAKVASSRKVSNVDGLPLQKTKNSRVYGQSSKKVKGSRVDKKMLFSVDYITDRMKNLLITTNNGKKVVQEEQSAIVPYRGDGPMVAYEAFEPIKKRQARPKVDLDPETNRLWNLLMGKEASESTQAVDSDKEKWWEEERKVFRGRVDSFIARMHLVQGDRRFSRWKGSVVDSVIGVFLTQNVSDHLSSSAFMSLAAKFPLKSTTMRPPCCQNGGSPSTDQHFLRVTYPDGTTSYEQQMNRDPACIYSSVTSNELSEFRSENAYTGRTRLTNEHTRRTVEEIISSQSSSESFILQASEDIRSSSGSNSEAEDHSVGLDLNRIHVPPSLPERVERVPSFQQRQFQVMGSPLVDNTDHQLLGKPVYGPCPGLASSGNVYSYPFTSAVSQCQSSVPSSATSCLSTSTGLEKWEADILSCSGKESLSSLASLDFGIAIGTGVDNRHYNAGQRAESYSAQHHGSNRRNSCNFIEMWQGGVQETFQQDGIVLADTPRPEKALLKQPIENQERSENVTLGPTAIPNVNSSAAASTKISTTTSNARKRKAEKEKVEPINWDTLRTELRPKEGTRGINPNAMDSLDYEAVRTADVRKISDTIKERGMNNMLAERMKDFLNRVVQDHGQIDLEWLRDVQPDKAKDYLLSIRGLGLKSVECVRLLTLHHLAFPVDTNVGRIAVRLGWVPLQPLPESLQLHLLELYPMLETIQKYLWPRLCKLDQETLYELHYQMITFGKVFCTKREPNCNACPMRGECRHFASAFASARLALPGPEDKRVVSSAAPTFAKKVPEVMIKPLQLLTPGDDLEIGTRFMRNSEPIIEEPSTPEAPVEVSERDIEDAFYEDPDEIPVIKLNIEEFTTNLQSFMQENMELQEGDLSKALVALSPELASIPIPKLKHVSRLRTEHQVYELPDSHPLLKGLDRREPDDPSPYLLAIWTPGETADSIQPPESNCCSQEGGGLCDKKTCFSCNSTREADAQTVRGTFLIPCRTAMRGSFPLNGTYFQVNEMFADHASSINPIDVPRNLLWNLPRRTVFFGTSVSTIFKGLSTEGIQFCFWKGFVCVRGFDRESRAPRPLRPRLHYHASKVTKRNEQR